MSDPTPGSLRREVKQIERSRCLNIVTAWTKAQHIRLHAGEMTAGEMRAVKAVVSAIARQITTE